MATLNSISNYDHAEIQTAGPRYTPTQDPNAPNLRIQVLEDNLDLLALSSGFYDTLDRLTKVLEKAIRDHNWAIKGLFLRRKINPQSALTAMQKFRSSSYRTILKNAEETKRQINVLHDVVSKRRDKLFGQEYRREKDENKLSEEELKNRRQIEEKVRSEQNRLYNFLGDIREVHSYLNSKKLNLLSNNKFLLLGNWGTGKTHILCDYTKRLLSNKHTVLFTVAQNFPLGTDPLNALCDRSGLYLSVEDAFKDLNSKGVKSGNRSLIIFDGINEGDRDYWKPAVKKLLNLAKKYKRVGLVLSCRSPFEEILFSAEDLESFHSAEHIGFDEIEFEAQKEFFRYYKIPLPEVPLLSEEFSRPLTIKLICSSLQKLSKEKKKKTFDGIASGQKGMTFILERYIVEVGDAVEKQYGLPHKFCWELIKGAKRKSDKVEDGIAARMAQQLKEVITHGEAIEVIKGHSGWTSDARAKSLLKSLVHAGILFEHYTYIDDQLTDAVRLPYQKFSDHIIARHLLGNYLNTKKDLATVKRCFYKNRPLGKIFALAEYSLQYPYANWAEALMIEFPERIKNLSKDQRELLWYLPKSCWQRSAFAEPFLDSLLWRSSASFSKGTDNLVGWMLKNSKDYNYHRILDVLLALAVKPAHPYNAKAMNNYLSKKSLTNRDLTWSEYLRGSHEQSTPERIILWASKIAGQRITKSVARNCMTMLMWFLTSVQTHQRDRATEALVIIGMQHPDLLFKLALDSLKLNDPYVTERMLSAAYGVAMNKWAERSKKFIRPFEAFCKNLVSQMYLPSAAYATHNVVMRECSMGCFELADLLGIKYAKRDEKKYLKPPYSQIPFGFKKPSAIKKKVLEDAEWAFQMDFSNYTVGGMFDDRHNYQDNHKEYIIAMKQLKARVYELGYRKNKFENIDRYISEAAYRGGRHGEVGRTERYGKKYGWIAYYEMYGYREANGLMETDGHRLTDISIDPSIPKAPKHWLPKLPDPFKQRYRGPSNWLTNGGTPNYKRIFKRKSIKGEKGPWILLHADIEQKEDKKRRMVLTHVMGVAIAKQDVAEAKSRFLDHSIDSGSNWPHPSSDHYTFAGEIPWSKRFATWQRKKRRIDRVLFELFREGKWIETKPREAPVEMSTLITGIEDGVMSLDLSSLIARMPKGHWKYTKGIKAEVLYHQHAWESNHSLVNDYTHFEYPTPAMADYLKLVYKNRSVDLYDRSGRKATVYASAFRKENEALGGTQLLYIREDLLKRYLNHHETELIWLIHGSRKIHYSMYDRLGASREPKVRDGIYDQKLDRYEELVSFV